MSSQAEIESSLSHVRVGDCMRASLRECADTASLSEVAGVMATSHVHAVLLTPAGGARPTGLLCDLDLVAAAASTPQVSAREASRSEPVSIAADESLARAADVMASRRAAHLIVLDPASGHPVGILSTLDVAAVLAGTSARSTSEVTP